MTDNNRRNGTKSVKAYKTNKNDEPPAKRRKLNNRRGGTKSVKAYKTNKNDEPPAKRRKLNPKTKVKSD